MRKPKTDPLGSTFGLFCALGNTYTHLGLEDAAEELRRMEEAENDRMEQEKLAGKAKDSQKLFKAV